MLRALHAGSLLLLLVALLYGAAHAHASEAPDASVPTSAADPGHIALLLPTGSTAFSSAAESVRSGFTDAAKKEQGFAREIRVYSVGDDAQQVLGAYRAASAAGARIVVGPLTRNGVTALARAADEITVPTLALNVPENVGAYPPKLNTFGLQIEAEARQAARLALKDGRRKALTVTVQNPLARRMREAFVDEFQAGGGFQIADYSYATDAAAFDRLREAAATGTSDMVFLAMDAQRARVVRPHVATLPGYGTSQLNPGLRALAAFVELDDIRFVDMPWMLQPDNPVVLTYLRDTPRQSDDLERLYALGIDAFRVAQALLAGKLDIDIDGVSGHLTLDPSGEMRRGLLAAHIAAGQLTVLGEVSP